MFPQAKLSSQLTANEYSCEYSVSSSPDGSLNHKLPHRVLIQALSTPVDCAFFNAPATFHELIQLAVTLIRNQVLLTFERANSLPSRLRPIGSFFPSLGIRPVIHGSFPQTSSAADTISTRPVIHGSFPLSSRIRFPRVAGPTPTPSCVHWGVQEGASHENDTPTGRRCNHSRLRHQAYALDERRTLASERVGRVGRVGSVP